MCSMFQLECSMEHKEAGKCKTVSNERTDSKEVIPMCQSVYAGDKKAPNLLYVSYTV